MNNDVNLLAEAYELILEKKGKGKDWVPPWAKKEDEKEDEKDEKDEKGGSELTAKQKKLPPALQAAMKKKKMTKKEKVAESFERLYEDFWNYFED